MVVAPLCAAFVIVKRPVHATVVVTVYAPLCAAFVIPQGTVQVIRDSTHDAEVVFDHDKSGAQRSVNRDDNRGVDGSFHDDKSGVDGLLRNDKSDTQRGDKRDEHRDKNMPLAVCLRQIKAQ